MSLIAIVIVNYNQLLKNSAIFKKDMDSNQELIFVVDNSTNVDIQKQNLEYCSEKRNVTYLSHEKNLGISKAYNVAIKEIRKTDCQYLLLLDADTDIASEYIEKMKELLERKEIDLILPIIRTKKGAIMSPCKRGKYGLFKHYDDIAQIEVNHQLSAINSGMCISRNIWESYQYDEQLFLDYVDHQFMKDFFQRSNKIYIMKDIVLVQDFSAETDDLQKAKFRYSIQTKDIRYFLKKNKYPFYCIWIHMWRRKLRLFIKNKKPEVLFW